MKNEQAVYLMVRDHRPHGHLQKKLVNALPAFKGGNFERGME